MGGGVIFSSASQICPYEVQKLGQCQIFHVCHGRTGMGSSKNMLEINYCQNATIFSAHILLRILYLTGKFLKRRSTQFTAQRIDLITLQGRPIHLLTPIKATYLHCLYFLLFYSSKT